MKMMMNNILTSGDLNKDYKKKFLPVGSLWLFLFHLADG